MVERLRAGTTQAYLAYVDGRPAGWVNASRRCDHSLHRGGESSSPADDEVVGVACFVVGPAYRRHGVAGALLDRVVADAAGRGVAWVEGYPLLEDEASFRGARSLYEERGFVEVAVRSRDVVVRRPAGEDPPP